MDKKIKKGERIVKSVILSHIITLNFSQINVLEPLVQLKLKKRGVKYV